MSEAGAGVMQRTAGPGPRGEGGWLARLKKGSLMAAPGSRLTAAFPSSCVPRARRGPCRHSFMVCDP